MRDATGRYYQRMTRAVESFNSSMSGSGYELIDTPLLEETELFVRKSGGELASRLYTFIDPGGHRVSLRPEFTSSVIRHYIQARESLALPVRWQYSGPVFRYERENEGAYRQFTQVGAELIGTGGIEADAEVLYLAWEGLKETGLRSYRMRVGHIGVLHELLSSYGLSEPAKLFIIGNVQALKSASTSVAKLMQQAKDTGLLKTARGFAPVAGGMEIGADASRESVLEAFREGLSDPYGRRTPDQIVERLLLKARVADDPANLEEALGLVSQLAQVDGSPADALDRARQIAGAHGLKTLALEDVAEMFTQLHVRGVDEARISLEFGYALGLSYYTGVVFEIVYPSLSGEIALGSGGRYDGLVRALGGEDVPALGFAFTVDRVVEALKGEESEPADMIAASTAGEEGRATTGGA